MLHNGGITRQTLQAPDIKLKSFQRLYPSVTMQEVPKDKGHFSITGHGGSQPFGDCEPIYVVKHFLDPVDRGGEVKMCDCQGS